jgi:DNA repair exonuclease SbcCD nuclease subunit
MKILFTADWHILLGQKNVPAVFQQNRFYMLVDRINDIAEQHGCDLIMIGGDILDRCNPSALEVELYFEVINRLRTATWIYSGNHEMRSKYQSVLDNLAAETSRSNPLVTVVGSMRTEDFDIIDYKELHKAAWQPQVSKLCFTHVRGAIPPHVTPEVDLARFNGYHLVVSGDLHSHQCSQKNAEGLPFIYPGSPLTTSFHRTRTTDANGCLIVDTDNLLAEWISLSDLPQLIRKTAEVGDQMTGDDYDRVIYEVVGDITQLKQLEDSELIDKKVYKNLGSEAVLDIKNNEPVTEELSKWMQKIEGLSPAQVTDVLSLFETIVSTGARE